MGSIVSRTEWGARLPKGPYSTVDPKPRAVLHHSAGPVPKDKNHAATIVRAYQYQHMFTNQLAPGGANDIGYHALVDAEGNVYLGRPFATYGAHAPGGNELTGICMLGNFDIQRPPSAMVTAVYDFCRAKGIHEIIGHRALYPTACPGIYGMETAEGLNHSLKRVTRPVDRIPFPPPHGRTLRLYINGVEYAGWGECNNRIVSIAIHPASITTDNIHISWNHGVWHGRTDVINVCRHLYAKFNLAYR